MTIEERLLAAGFTRYPIKRGRWVTDTGVVHLAEFDALKLVEWMEREKLGVFAVRKDSPLLQQTDKI